MTRLPYLSMAGISCEAQVNQMCVSWLSSLGGWWVLGTAWAWTPLVTRDSCERWLNFRDRRWLSRVESLILGCWLHSSATPFQESSDGFLVGEYKDTNSSWSISILSQIWAFDIKILTCILESFVLLSSPSSPSSHLFTPHKHVTSRHQAMMLGICGLPAESLQDMFFFAHGFWWGYQQQHALDGWRTKLLWSQWQKHGCTTAFVNNCSYL